MKNSTISDDLRKSALCIMRENFSIRELADLTGTDYHNMCAYMSGRRPLPLKIAFFVLDYLGCRCVIFRNR